MTEKELKDKNPWKEVAKMLNPNEEDCLFREESKEWYVCSDDKKRIRDFNNDCKKKEFRIVTNTPPEPWRGNPLKANLILLSLNSGYDQNINESLAKLLQSNETVRKELVDFRRRTLELDAVSFMPEKENKEPISCFEAEDMLSGWYWTKKFKELRKASGIKEESDFYKRIALVEFHGYSSMNYHEWYGNQPTLESQNFNKLLIQHIIENRKDVFFLVLRSWETSWKNLLPIDIVENNSKRFLINNNPRCQYITEKNLTTKVWKKVLEAVNRKPID